MFKSASFEYISSSFIINNKIKVNKNIENYKISSDIHWGVFHVRDSIDSIWDPAFNFRELWSIFHSRVNVQRILTKLFHYWEISGFQFQNQCSNIKILIWVCQWLFFNAKHPFLNWGHNVSCSALRLMGRLRLIFV